MKESIIDYNRNKNFDEVDILQAARLIFLNKTCFNGIYRVNSKGEFNVPMGRYKNPSFYDENNLKNVSACLQKTEIYNKSYDFFRNMIDEDSFVYLDPPYRPITETSFTSYTKSSTFKSCFNKAIPTENKNSNRIDTDNIFKCFDDYLGMNMIFSLMNCIGDLELIKFLLNVLLIGMEVIGDPLMKF